VNCEGVTNPAQCAARLVAARTDFVVLIATGDQEGEQHDRAALGVRAVDLELLTAVHRALPSVRKAIVVASGGAVSTERAESMVQATIWSGKAGMRAGAGFASLLYGDRDFSGRVAATVYKEAWAATSDFLDGAVSGGLHPRGYRYLKEADAGLVLYDFGHGLSYRSGYVVELDAQHYTISAAELERGGNLTVSATVTAPAATMESARSVLLFLSLPPSTPEPTALPRRNRWLADFAKTRIAPGATKATVRLAIVAASVSRWVPSTGGAASTDFVHGADTVQKGTYHVELTDSAATATLTVT